jgi:hypothetical protein
MRKLPNRLGTIRPIQRDDLRYPHRTHCWIPVMRHDGDKADDGIAVNRGEDGQVQDGC